MTAKLENYVDFIRREYLDNGHSVDEMLEIIKNSLGIEISTSTFEKFRNKHKINKNKKRDHWAYADYHLNKRKREGKESELVINGQIIPKSKYQKEIPRHVTTLEQLIQRNGSGPPTPEGCVVRTPQEACETEVAPSDFEAGRVDKMDVEERTPSPPQSPLRGPAYPAMSGGLDEASGIAGAPLIAAPPARPPAFFSSYPGLYEAASQYSVIQSPPVTPAQQDSVPPRFTRQRRIDEGTKSGRNRLNPGAVQEIMQKCGLFMQYWNWVGTSTFSETIMARYENLALLVSTDIPWDSFQINYIEDLGINYEVFDALDLLYAALGDDMERYERALVMVDLELFEDVLYTALFIAASNGSIGILRNLLKIRLCRVDWQARDKTTCLHNAAVHNQSEAVKALLESKPDLEKRCRWGETALFKICGWKEHEEVFRLLLSAGAEVHTHNYRGESSLRAAQENRDYNSIATMIARGLEESGMCEGCRLRDQCFSHEELYD